MFVNLSGSGRVPAMAVCVKTVWYASCFVKTEFITRMYVVTVVNVSINL